MVKIYFNVEHFCYIRTTVVLTTQYRASTMGDYLELKFNIRNQIDDKIAWGLSGGFLPLC